jgi:hypothetical protein
MTRNYEIEERPANLGGGWVLTMFEDEEEMGRGYYPLPDLGEPFDDDELKFTMDALHDEAMSDGESWVSLSTD